MSGKMSLFIGPRSAVTASLTAAAVVVGAGCRADSEAELGGVLSVLATDYAFEAPDQVEGGVVKIELRNDGPAEHHHVVLVRLPAGKTAEDFLSVKRETDQPPSWAIHAGGLEPVDPGGEAEGTLILEAGEYLLICYVMTPGGVRHLELGMVRSLRVLEPTVGVREPEPDLELSMFDYGYVLSDSLRSGRRTIRVVNGGPQVHNVVVWKLDRGKHVEDVRAWYEEGRKGAPPGRRIGGMGGLSPGRHAYFTADFEPGSYAFFCMVNDVGDGRPHIFHEMILELTIPT
jgi:hypothetical protein